MSNGGSGGAAGGAAVGAAPAEGTGLTDQSGQIGDMLSSLDLVGDEGGETDKGGEETGGEAGKESGKEATAAGKEGAGAEGAGEGAEEDPIKTLTATVQTLTMELAALKAAKPGKEVEAGVKEEPPKPDVFFKDKAEYDSAFENPEILNTILNKVANAGSERILKALPKIIRTVVKQQVEMQTETVKFFGDNKDLLPHRQFASFVANDLIGKNPNWTLSQLYTELGKEVRTRLGLKAGAVANAGKKGTGAGAFPGTKGTGARQVTGKGAQLTPLEKEIKEMIE